MVMAPRLLGKSTAKRLFTEWGGYTRVQGKGSVKVVVEAKYVQVPGLQE